LIIFQCRLAPRNTPLYNDFTSRAARFESFNQGRNNPHCSFADAGFFSKGHGDSVLCFFCGGELLNWRSHDPWLEHAKWFGYCPYILKTKGQNFIDSAVKLRKGFMFECKNFRFQPADKFLEEVPRVVYLTVDTC
jgi:Inhibitor of Apoptosis domain